jgi:hypothetical protein
VLALSVVSGCFAEPAPTDAPCDPGTQIACDCLKGDGVQVCRISGDGFEPCQCAGGSGSDGGSDSGSMTSTTVSTGDSTTATDASDTADSADTSTSSSPGTTTGVEPTTTTGPTDAEVVINELVHDPIAGQEDWIELYNRGDTAVDVSGWLISDGGNFFAIAQGTILEPDAYLLYTRNEPGSFTWGFGDDEVAVLYDAEGQQVDMCDWALGEATEPDSFGRLPNGSGPFVELTPTKGAANE